MIRKKTSRKILQSPVSRVSESCTTAVDSNSHATDQVAHANRDARPEKREAGIVRIGGEEHCALHSVDFRGEDDGHDDAIDGDDLAEDDGDEILGADTGSFDTTAQDRRTGNEDAPIGVYMSAG